MLALSAGTTQTRTLGTASIPSVGDMSARARQCLVLGNYTEATEHVLEALMLHLQSHFLKGVDGTDGLWFVMGTILRLALRMGYHRDPARIRDDAGGGGLKLTPFRAEMRRRVWVSIYQIDALVSFQMGLPSMLPMASCDCELPRNLEYADFGPDTAELPPGRPPNDHTTVSYIIAKNPPLTAFRKVVAHTQALGPPSHEETAALDAMVRTTSANVPEILRAKPIARSLVDAASVIIRRITIEMLSLKTLVVLHRRHLDHDADAGACASHQACLRAALQMLERQAEMAEASRAGGLLHSERWMISTLTANDLILASVVVCLDLTIRTRGGRPCACHDTADALPPVTLEEELEAVKRAHAIWDAAGAHSAEARVAARALEGTMRRVDEYQQGAAAQASAVPYEDLQRISFRDDAGLGGMDVTYEEGSPNAYHWVSFEKPGLACWGGEMMARTDTVLAAGIHRQLAAQQRRGDAGSGCVDSGGGARVLRTGRDSWSVCRVKSGGQHKSPSPRSRIKLLFPCDAQAALPTPPPYISRVRTPPRLAGVRETPASARRDERERREKKISMPRTRNSILK